MTDWNLSIVIIVPAHLQDKANRLSCALGHDVLPGNTFSVPLSDNGTDITHYGCRTSAKQEFVDIMTGASEGQLPEIGWSDYGVTIDDIAEIVAVKIFDVRGAGDAAGHFEKVIADHGLVRPLTKPEPQAE